MARRKRTIGIIAGAMPINLYMKGVFLILRRRCWPLGPAPDRRPIHYRNGVGRLAGGSGRNAARYGCPRPPPRRRARPSSSRVADGRVAPATTLGLRHRPALLTEISVFAVTGPASLPNRFVLVRRKTSPKSGPFRMLPPDVVSIDCKDCMCRVSTQITGKPISARAPKSHCDSGPASNPIRLKW
jgi:hypothetical protein